MWHAVAILWLVSFLALLSACRTAPALVEVHGGSMEPAIHDGQFVFVDTRTRDFAIGDVVLVQHPAHKLPVIHRVAWISATTVWTKGDANSAADVPLPRAAILGRVIHRNPTTQ